MERTWTGPAFRFPEPLPGGDGAVLVGPGDESLLAPWLDDWKDDVVTSAPLLAVPEEGRAVSLCCSVRRTARAHEAGVETHPDFRGMGYGTRAVAAWAAAVREVGATPLYSTSWQNVASRALAARLGLVPFGSDLHVS